MNITLIKTCPICGNRNVISVPEDVYNKWILLGASIEDAWPDGTAEQKYELVFGAHKECE